MHGCRSVCRISTSRSVRSYAASPGGHVTALRRRGRRKGAIREGTFFRAERRGRTVLARALALRQCNRRLLRSLHRCVVPNAPSPSRRSVSYCPIASPRARRRHARHRRRRRPPLPSLPAGARPARPARRLHGEPPPAAAATLRIAASTRRASASAAGAASPAAGAARARAPPRAARFARARLGELARRLPRRRARRRRGVGRRRRRGVGRGVALITPTATRFLPAWSRSASGRSRCAAR